MLRVLPFIVIIAVLAAGTVWQGDVSERWYLNTSDKLDAFADRLDDVPTTIGQWEAGPDQVLNKREWERAHCAAYVSREYRHPDGQVVSMFLVAGSGRNVTIHTPDQCYVGAGFKMEKTPERREVSLENAEQANAQFATTTFLRESSTEREHLLILWSYTEDGQWAGPTRPKPVYGYSPALFKVYLVTQLNEGDSKEALESASATFARDLMPVLSEVLFPEPSSEDEDTSEAEAEAA